MPWSISVAFSVWNSCGADRGDIHDAVHIESRLIPATATAGILPSHPAVAGLGQNMESALDVLSLAATMVQNNASGEYGS